MVHDQAKKLDNRPPQIRKHFSDLIKFFKARVSKDETLLEAGCGGSFMLPWQSKAAKMVVGIDFSDSEIAESSRFVKKRRLNNVVIEQQDFFHMPPGYVGHFNIICLFSNTLGNFEDLRKVELLRSFTEALKDGGRIFLHLYDETPASRKVRIEYYERMGLENVHYERSEKAIYYNGICSDCFSEEKIQELTKLAGLELTECVHRDIGYFVVLTKPSA